MPTVSQTSSSRSGSSAKMRCCSSFSTISVPYSSVARRSRRSKRGSGPYLVQIVDSVRHFSRERPLRALR